MVEMGFCEVELEVPLFAELYGFGPFIGRRNQGILDPLHSRALAMGDASGRRTVLIVSEVVVTDDVMARSLRAEIAAENAIHPDGIMFGAIHTHCGPAVSLGIGWGEICPEFITNLREGIKAAARGALLNLEPIVATCGRAPMSKIPGVNRVFENGPVDESIRWVEFMRPADSSVKLLLYNHGMHGVNLGRLKLVSADWSGAVNRRVLERGLAENVMFVYGTAGNINTNPVGCGADPEQGRRQLQDIAVPFVADLEADFGNGRELNLEPIGHVLETVDLPVAPMSADEMRRCVAVLREEVKSGAPFSDVTAFRADRLTEMALLYDAKKLPARVAPDLQVIRAGELAFYGFPGEPFIELGNRIMKESAYRFALCSTVTNGNCRYFPTRETFELYPEGMYSQNRGYGYYEIYQGCGRYMPAYTADIADFIVERFLSMRAI